MDASCSITAVGSLVANVFRASLSESWTPLDAKYGIRNKLGRISISSTLAIHTPIAAQLFHGGSFGDGWLGRGNTMDDSLGTFGNRSTASVFCTNSSLANRLAASKYFFSFLEF